MEYCRKDRPDGRVSVAVVEDDPFVREHLESILGGDAEFHLHPGAGTIEEAQAKLDPPPGVVLVDLGLPDGDGTDLIRWLKSRSPVIILVVTALGDRESVTRAFAAGADGYLAKDTTASRMTDAIRSALQGGTPISAGAATHLLSRLRASLAQEEACSEAARNGLALTKRETELLELFAKGLTYQETAASLGISRHTVNDHVKSIYRKLGVKSRSEAVYEALQDNLIQVRTV